MHGRAYRQVQKMQNDQQTGKDIVSQETHKAPLPVLFLIQNESFYYVGSCGLACDGHFNLFTSGFFGVLAKINKILVNF